MKRIAITRAEPEASATAARIRALGGEPVLAPLLDIKPAPFDTGLEGVEALLFTSVNGIRAFAAATPERAIRVLCVGDATAGAAREAGFTDVESADGDSRALAAYAVNRLRPHAGVLLHISGRDVSGDLVAALAAQGFTAERRITYAAEIVQAFPRALQSPVDIMLFHSARAAAAFAALGSPHASEMIAACLSEQVANEARKSPFKDVIVAPRPREDALLHAILAP